MPSALFGAFWVNRCVSEACISLAITHQTLCQGAQPPLKFLRSVYADKQPNDQDLLYNVFFHWKESMVYSAQQNGICGGCNMDRTEIVTITNMCMVYDGNKVLVQEKIDDDYRGVTFPGGHVEKGESFTDAVIREVFEETGLRISSPILCGIKDWSNDDGSRVYGFIL